MKILFTLAFSLMVTYLTYAQERDFSEEQEMQTVFNRNKKAKVSGFISPAMSFSTINVTQGSHTTQHFAHYMGGGLAVTINNFFLGGYGQGLTVEIDYPGGSEGEYINFGHGGLWFGYTFASKWVVHPVVHVRTGWGSIGKRYSYNDNHDWPDLEESGDAVFVVAPTVELEANISRFFRISAGYERNYVNGINEIPALVNGMNNEGVFIAFKFGWFY